MNLQAQQAGAQSDLEALEKEVTKKRGYLDAICRELVKAVEAYKAADKAWEKALDTLKKPAQASEEEVKHEPPPEVPQYEEEEEAVGAMASLLAEVAIQPAAGADTMSDASGSAAGKRQASLAGSAELKKLRIQQKETAPDELKASLVAANNAAKEFQTILEAKAGAGASTAE